MCAEVSSFRVQCLGLVRPGLNRGRACRVRLAARGIAAIAIRCAKAHPIRIPSGRIVVHGVGCMGKYPCPYVNTLTTRGGVLTSKSLHLPWQIANGRQAACAIDCFNNGIARGQIEHCSWPARIRTGDGRTLDEAINAYRAGLSLAPFGGCSFPSRLRLAGGSAMESAISISTANRALKAELSRALKYSRCVARGGPVG